MHQPILSYWLLFSKYPSENINCILTLTFYQGIKSGPLSRFFNYFSLDCDVVPLWISAKIVVLTTLYKRSSSEND